ncbi:MAG: hypothetical protein WCK96_11815 [Methylococcales bacterium]
MKKILLALTIITTSVTVQARVSNLCEEQLMAAVFVKQYEDLCNGSFNIASLVSNTAGQACRINGDNLDEMKKSLLSIEEKNKIVSAKTERFCNQGSMLYNKLSIEFRQLH